VRCGVLVRPVVEAGLVYLGFAAPGSRGWCGGGGGHGVLQHSHLPTQLPPCLPTCARKSSANGRVHPHTHHTHTHLASSTHAVLLELTTHDDAAGWLVGHAAILPFGQCRGLTKAPAVLLQITATVTHRSALGSPSWQQQACRHRLLSLLPTEASTASRAHTAGIIPSSSCSAEWLHHGGYMLNAKQWNCSCSDL
jgi:hypothetical protein